MFRVLHQPFVRVTAFVVCACCTVFSAPQAASPAGKILVDKALPNGDLIRVKGSTYDYRSAGVEKSGRLWIPPNVKVVMGVMIDMNAGGVAGDNKAFAGDTNLQMFAARNSFALLGIGGFSGMAMYDRGGADTIFYMLDEFAKAADHPELANVPFIMHGSSNGGMATYGTVNNRPLRCICWVSNVGARFNPARPTDEAIKVPGIMIVGPNDHIMSSRGVGDTRTMIRNVRKRGGLWSWIAEQDKDHETRNVLDINMKFYENAIKARLPKDADPRKGPVKLNDIPEASGWLTNAEVYQTELTYIAPYSEYTEDKTIAGWILDKDVAFLHRGLSTFKSPASIGVKEYRAIQNIHVGPAELMVVANPTITPGEKITVEVTVAKPRQWGRPGQADTSKVKLWDSIQVYNGGALLGTIASGRAPELTVTVQPQPMVYALTALVYDDRNGQIYPTIPFHFIVSDPKIKDLINKIKSVTTVRPAKKVLGSLTAGKGVAAGVALAQPDPGDSVLVVYGLSKAQEAQFNGSDRKVSPFWTLIDDKHDCARLTVASNGGDPKNWKSAWQTLPKNPTLNGDADAGLLVKAARSSAGLYLYIEITDDQWYPSRDKRIEFDNLDVLFDSRSSQKLWEGPVEKSFVNPGWSVSMTTRQLQVDAGDSSVVPGFFHFGFPDPWQMLSGVYTMDDGRKEFGLEFDGAQTSPTTRVQEWFIPWDELGVSAEPQDGARLAFAPGYNDMDQKDHDGQRDSDGNIMHDKLRWLNRTGPWAHASKDGPHPAVWGDLEMGPALK
jgi:hypothetical protein